MTIQYKISIIIIAITASFAHGQDLPSVCAEDTVTYGVKGFSNSEFIWAVEDGAVIRGEGSDSIDMVWGYNTGVKKLEVLEVTHAGCSNASVIAEVEVKAPYLDFGFDYLDFCSGDSILLEPYVEYNDEYVLQWQGDSNDNVFSKYISAGGMYWVNALADDGCDRKDTIFITQNELPDFDLGEDLIVCAIDGGAFVDVGNIGVDYYWTSSLHDEENTQVYGNSSEQQLLSSTQADDTVTLYVTDYNGCVNSDTMIAVACDLDALFQDMPNTFTPDGNGINDEWNFSVNPDYEIANILDYFPDAVLEIFDRQGRLVFRTENVDTEFWNGKSKGKALPMDAYYYILDLNFLDAQPIVGTVNIVK